MQRGKTKRPDRVRDLETWGESDPLERGTETWEEDRGLRNKTQRLRERETDSEIWVTETK